MFLFPPEGIISRHGMRGEEGYVGKTCCDPLMTGDCFPDVGRGVGPAHLSQGNHSQAKRYGL